MWFCFCLKPFFENDRKIVCLFRVKNLQLNTIKLALTNKTTQKSMDTFDKLLTTLYFHFKIVSEQ